MGGSSPHTVLTTPAGFSERLEHWEVTLADVRVTCINKQPRQNPHEGITHLGGQGWWWTRRQVIDSINGGTNSFYTLEGGRRANVAVVNGPNGQYLRTHADGACNDNLLALAECS